MESSLTPELLTHCWCGFRPRLGPPVSERTCSQQIFADLSDTSERFRYVPILLSSCLKKHRYKFRYKENTAKTCQRISLQNSFSGWFSLRRAHLLLRGLWMIWVWRAWDKVKNHHMLTAKASRFILKASWRHNSKNCFHMFEPSQIWVLDGSSRNSWGMIEFSFALFESRELLGLRLNNSPKLQTHNPIK